jgi:hypothetical protein
MITRPGKTMAHDGLTVGHLQKGLTTGHLQQAVGGSTPAEGTTPNSSSGGTSSVPTTPTTNTQNTGGTGSK